MIGVYRRSAHAEAAAEIPGEFPQTVSGSRHGQGTDYNDCSGQTHQPEPELYQKVNRDLPKQIHFQENARREFTE